MRPNWQSEVALVTMIFLLIIFLLGTTELLYVVDGDLLASVACNVSLSEYGSIIGGSPLEYNGAPLLLKWTEPRIHFNYRAGCIKPEMNIDMI